MNTYDSEKNELQFRRTVLGVLLMLGICSSIAISPWMLLPLNFFAGIIAVVRAFIRKYEITKKPLHRKLVLSATAVIFGFPALFCLCLPEEVKKTW